MKPLTTERVFEDEAMLFEWWEDGSVLFIRWNIPADDRPLSDFQRNLEMIVTQSTQKGAVHIVSDHRQYSFSSFEPEYFQVVAEYLIPSLVNSGVRRIAMIQPDNLHVVSFLDRLAEAGQAYPAASFESRFFDTEEAALVWILAPSASAS